MAVLPQPSLLLRPWVDISQRYLLALYSPQWQSEAINGPSLTYHILRGISMSCNQTERQEDESPNRSLSEQIIREVAAKEGVDPIELTPPLFAVIEPDALDALYANSDDRPEITFTWQGYTISADSEGRIQILDE